MIGIGIVGYGYWGPRLARNFDTLDSAQLRAICDQDESRLAVARRQFPHALCLTEPEALLEDPEICAIAIATPTASHYALARACLRAGKHVLVEKPLAASSEQATALTREAKRQGKVLLVDHTWLFSGLLRATRHTLATGALGEVTHLHSTRVGFGRFRTDVDVMWDLASHDLAIVDHLFQDKPGSVQAVGYSRGGKPLCELATLRLRWGDYRRAEIHVSWLSPKKVRRLQIHGSRGTLNFDHDDARSRLYLDTAAAPERGDSAGRANREAAGSNPRELPFDRDEPLGHLVRHFVDCITEGEPPLADGIAAARVIRWLEAARSSMRSDGVEVAL